jgi:type VI secretion system protein ImpA
MSQPNWSEFESFLTPISAHSPSGISLRYEPIYDQIQDARRQEDVTLPQGVWKREMKVADWAQVEKLCTQVLTQQSKDLQVAAWLTEAWLHENGIRGLARGVRLMQALCESFWDSLHPQIDADGADYRLAPIDWCNVKLSEKLSLYAISNPEQEGQPYYTIGEYEYLQNTGDMGKTKKSQAGQKELNIPAMQASIKGTADYFYEILYQDCLETIRIVADFEAYLSHKLGAENVSLYQLRNGLGKFRDCMLAVLSERDLLDAKPKTLELELPLEPEAIPVNDEISISQTTTVNLKVNGKIESREQAYAMIAEIAKYLETIEPHSPTPYLLKKAIAWGNMPLSYLLHEFIQNNMDFVQLQRWLGIPNPVQSDATLSVAKKMDSQ